jgi:hypothetical protein
VDAVVEQHEHHTATAASEEDTFPPGSTVAPHTCGGTTESFIQAYRYFVSILKAGKLYSGKPAFVGVGYGSDFNGLAGWPAPRFTSTSVTGGTDFGQTLREAFVGGSTARPAGYCYLFTGTVETSGKPFVHYPFKSPLTGQEFDKSSLPWSGRTAPYDVSTDGVAHVGMIPDFVEEMRVLGLTDEDLAPLWHGAEAYIREWEAAQSFAGSYSPEHGAGIREQCRQLRTQLVDTIDTPDVGGPIVDVVKTRQKWSAAISALRAAHCHGTT